ncbi:MAG: hypothetical protein AB7S72_00770 [Draconibacterium sp.]
MKNTIRNIAFLLFGIFSFPLIYQPFHVVVHHGHTSCANCTITCSEPHSDFGFAVFDVTEEKEEPCPICNYHFPLNEIPAEFLSLHTVIIQTGQVFYVPLKGYSKNIFSNLIPRAPPAC